MRINVPLPLYQYHLDSIPSKLKFTIESSSVLTFEELMKLHKNLGEFIETFKPIQEQFYLYSDTGKIQLIEENAELFDNHYL